MTTLVVTRMVVGGRWEAAGWSLGGHWPLSGCHGMTVPLAKQQTNQTKTIQLFSQHLIRELVPVGTTQPACQPTTPVNQSGRPCLTKQRLMQAGPPNRTSQPTLTRKSFTNHNNPINQFTCTRPHSRPCADLGISKVSPQHVTGHCSLGAGHGVALQMRIAPWSLR